MTPLEKKATLAPKSPCASAWFFVVVVLVLFLFFLIHINLILWEGSKYSREPRRLIVQGEEAVHP